MPLSDIAAFGNLNIGTDSNWQYFNNVGAFQSWTTGTTVPGNIEQVITTGFTEGTLRYHTSTKQWIETYTAQNNNAGSLPPNEAYYQIAGNTSGNFGARNIYSPFLRWPPGSRRAKPRRTQAFD